MSNPERQVSAEKIQQWLKGIQARANERPHGPDANQTGAP